MDLMQDHNLDIRAARSQDVPGMITVKHAAVFQIGAENYPPELLERWSGHLDQAHIKRLKDRVAEDTMQFCVAVLDKVVMGYGALDLESGEIGGPFTRPDHGREGIGSLILQRLEDDAAQAGLQEVIAESPPNVSLFFTKHGFTSMGPSSIALVDGGSLKSIRVKKKICCP